MSRHNRKWIKYVWAHQREQRTKDRLVKVPLVMAIRATVALVFNMWDEGEGGIPDASHHVAWRHIGTYYTDYGEGHAWTTLSVSGFRVMEFDDGSL
jgi:hypothetical protein